MLKRGKPSSAGGPRNAAALLATAALLLALPALAADEAAPSAPPPAAAVSAAEAAGSVVQIEVGRKTYTSYCTRCHGIRLVSNGIGFDLRTFPRDDKARFIRSVSGGLRAMPAWVGLLKPEDMDAIWAYIGSVNGWADAPAAQ